MDVTKRDRIWIRYQIHNRALKQESVRPRWPYDMRPSVRAEKYIRDASGWWKDVTDGNDNGTDGQTDRRTDRRTDRVRRNMRPPSREEGRIIILKVIVRYKITLQIKFTGSKSQRISFHTTDNYDSTSIWLPFDCNSAATRPRYDRTTTRITTFDTALQPR